MRVSNAIKLKKYIGQCIVLPSLLPPRPGEDEMNLIVNNFEEIMSKGANPKMLLL